ncbi:hypothetical protein F5141DRAFT_1218093 [Pisolithus sp. B1]|nr:hypothetical protein F5141DRAFT_1218093 [Pisolithus sp. B1]
MPALRPPPQQSSRLQVLVNQPISMAAKARQAAKQPEGTPVSGTVANPSPHVPSEESARGHGPSVSWDADPTCTDKLVSWMVSHSGDHNILFHDCLSNSTPLVLSPDDKPSGKNKKEVTTAITKHIFKHDLVYASLYVVDPGKFAMSVTNWLGMLKSKCCEQHARFSSTGSGVMPDGSTAPNLLAEVLRIFPYYCELNSIWHGIPSSDSELISSQLNANHAENFLALVKARSTQEGNCAEGGDPVADIEGRNDAAEEDGITSDIPVCCNESMDFVMNDPEIPEGLGNNYGVDGAMNEDHDDGMEGSSNPASHVCVDVGPTHRKDAVPTPFILKDKPRTPSSDGCNAFTRHSPYACPPTSVSGASVKPSSQGGTTSSTKKVSSMIAKKLEDLDKESDMYHGELEDLQTRCAVLQYNYAIWDKELELQWEELNSKCANAEIEFRWEQDLKKLEIELKKAEESAFSQQIELMQLQITLKVLEQAPSSSTAASGKIPTSAGPSSG